jgi:NADAR domain
MRELFATANTVLVEASADDTRWGIGTTKDDRSSWTRRTWRGENWLGDILTDVRDELMSKVCRHSSFLYLIFVRRTSCDVTCRYKLSKRYSSYDDTMNLDNANTMQF